MTTSGEERVAYGLKQRRHCLSPEDPNYTYHTEY